MSPTIRSSTTCTTSATFNYMSTRTLFLLPSTLKNSPLFHVSKTFSLSKAFFP
jgi:hypothetical protein